MSPSETSTSSRKQSRTYTSNKKVIIYIVTICIESLIDKKERLFKSKDINRWGINQVLDNTKLTEAFREELFKNKDKAFQFILPKETKELELKREELGFFTNQCWEEIKRVSRDNGALLREQFMEMS